MALRKTPLMFFGPGTLMHPGTAIRIAYQDGTLSEEEISDAVAQQVLTHYIMDDRVFVTLADLSEFVRNRSPGTVPVNGVLGRIYFIGFRHYIKIGFTLGRVADRVRGLQTGVPEPLSIYATMWGTKAAEGELHQRLSVHKINGEWFRRSQPLRSLVQRVRSTEWHRNLFPDERYPADRWAS